MPRGGIERFRWRCGANHSVARLIGVRLTRSQHMQWDLKSLITCVQGTDIPVAPAES